VTLCEGGHRWRCSRSSGHSGLLQLLPRHLRGGEPPAARAYIDYSRDDAFTNIMEYSHWRADARLVRTVVNESAATIAWLQDQGVEFTGQMANMPTLPVPITWSRATAKRGQGPRDPSQEHGCADPAGNAGCGPDKGAGRISGPRWTLTPRGRSGGQGGDRGHSGYVNNREWIKKYTGHDLGVDLIAVGNTGKMGDGIRMAWEAGAAEEGIEALQLIRVAPVGPEFAMATISRSWRCQPDSTLMPVPVVLRRERAFYDTNSGNANARCSGDGFTFSVFDDSILERVLEGGVDRGLSIHIPRLQAGETCEKNWPRRSPGAARKSCRRFGGGTGRAISADPVVLRATVDEYNGCCARGHDALFAKPARLLRPLVGPRYYAVKARTVCLGTMVASGSTRAWRR